MPPTAVRTIRELIYWEFAKLAAEIAVNDRKNYRYVMASYQRFKKQNLHPLQIMRQYGMDVKGQGQCAYCGSADDLVTTEIIPADRGGPDRIDNSVPTCRKHALEKGERDPFEWYGLDRRYEIPRLVYARYLKILFEEHSIAQTLDSKDLNKDGKLDIYDLDAIFKKVKA